MNATLNLSRDVPSRHRDALSKLPGIDVADAPQSVLIEEGSVRPIAFDRIGVAGVLQIEAAARDLATSGAVTVALIEGVLNDEAATRLEDAGVGYSDSAGRAWIPGAPRTALARADSSGGDSRARLGSASTRAAQILADHPRDPWSELELGERAEVGHSTAHSVLRRLERQGLVDRFGRGRTTKRRVADPRALRQWLFEHGGPTRPVRLPCFIRDPSSIPSVVDGVALVRTGAQGAELLGLPVLSGQNRPMLRVAVDREALEALPQRLGGFRTNRGANLLLLADPYRLGELDARQTPQGVSVAPPSRVLLDLRLEPRGRAAAEIFLELWGDNQL